MNFEAATQALKSIAYELNWSVCGEEAEWVIVGHEIYYCSTWEQVVEMVAALKRGTHRLYQG